MVIHFQRLNNYMFPDKARAFKNVTPRPKKRKPIPDDGKAWSWKDSIKR